MPEDTLWSVAVKNTVGGLCGMQSIEYGLALSHNDELVPALKTKVQALQHSRAADDQIRVKALADLIPELQNRIKQYCNPTLYALDAGKLPMIVVAFQGNAVNVKG